MHQIKNKSTKILILLAFLAVLPIYHYYDSKPCIITIPKLLCGY